MRYVPMGALRGGLPEDSPAAGRLEARHALLVPAALAAQLASLAAGASGKTSLAVSLLALPLATWAFVRLAEHLRGDAGGSDALPMYAAHLAFLASATFLALGPGPLGLAVPELAARGSRGVVGDLSAMCYLEAVLNGIATARWKARHWFFTGETDQERMMAAGRHVLRMFVLSVLLHETVLS